MWVLAHLLVSGPPTPVTMVWHFAYSEKMPAMPTLESDWSSGASLGQALHSLGLRPTLFPLFQMDGPKGTREVI